MSPDSSLSPSSRATIRVRVWDLPTRLFHVALAVCVVGAVVSAKIGGNAMAWHFRFGYAVLTLLLFRLAWGVVGGRWSRFRQFIYSPLTVWRYLRGHPAEGGAHWEVGHSPLGALSVWGMLLLFALQAGSGLVADDDIANTGPLVHLVSSATSSLMTRWHKSYGQFLILGLVALHVLAVTLYVLRGKNLVTPMVTGDKHLPSDVPPTVDRAPQRWLALAVLVVCALGVAGLIGIA